MTYNDLINVQFVDAAAHDIVETDDILGVVMPYHWGPAGEINIFNEQEFFEAYPEAKADDVDMTSTSAIAGLYNTYYKVKSYFANGGSRVAVYRPESGAYSGVDGAVTYLGDKTNVQSENYLVFKYPGLPMVSGDLALVATSTTASFTNGVASPNTVTYETFTGQWSNPEGVDAITGESTYLPTILANSSKYMTSVTDATLVEALDNTKTYHIIAPDATEESVDKIFASSDEMIPTQFIESGSGILGFQTATIFKAKGASSSNDRFTIDVDGTEKIKAFGTYHTITCEAGVAGAYAKIAKANNLNQVASARTYGSYNGIITSTKTFTSVVTDAENGIVSVFNSNNGPQIFGVRNSFASSKPSSYFSKANVTRVLTALLRNIKPMCIDAIHTQTAADAVLRAQFEVRLNSVINTFIGNADLQPDSIAICNASINSDVQTRGGQVLNIILSLHFIGLVERVNIKVVATDSSVTTSII